MGPRWSTAFIRRILPLRTRVGEIYGKYASETKMKCENHTELTREIHVPNLHFLGFQPLVWVFGVLYLYMDIYWFLKSITLQGTSSHQVKLGKAGEWSSQLDAGYGDMGIWIERIGMITVAPPIRYGNYYLSGIRRSEKWLDQFANWRII